MCQAPPDDHSLPRRNFLKLAGAAAVGLTFSGRASAADAKAPPRPQNVLSSDAALERLIKGNGRYFEGVMARHDFAAERPALVLGQNPFAGVLSCADSRVAPEVNRHPGISGGSLPCGNGAFGSIRSAMLAIMPGMWIMFITTRSSMGSSPESVIGRIRRFTVMSGSVCIQTTGRLLPWLETKAAMVNLTNNPRAHSAPYACSGVAK
ncbi:MAG: hypothetical protein M3495_02595 [Pseudomonadota bacterium]|nr:hypothetical protein [Pseudomonadota bacterium]